MPIVRLMDVSEAKFIDHMPPVGAYELNYYDVAMKAIKEEDENAVFGVNKPAFNISAARFQGAKLKKSKID
jgi:hypothetical protein